jgi:hypothetical protein
MNKTLLFFAIIGFIFNSTAQNIPNYVPTDSLIAYYPFNGDANDESGNSNNGTVNGATLTTDRHGNANSAYSFDGDDWIEITEILNFNNYSFSIWFRTDSSYGALFSKHRESSYSSSFTSYIHIDKVVNYMTATSTPAQSVASIDIINNGEWIHYVGTFDGDSLKVFINGELVASKVESRDVNSTNLNTLIGAWRNNSNTAYANFFDGAIDDIVAYNRALTENEINTLYNGNPCTDTIEVTVYDTMIVSDTVAINDTITTLDTVTTEIFDTTTIQVYDTIQVIDTVVTEINDTNLVTVADTLVITMSNDSNATGINVITTEVKVYPNPASSQLNIVIDLAGDYTVSMSNINGQMVFTQANVVSNIQIDISEFNTGLYFIKIIDNNGNLKSEERKVVIE